MSSYNPFRAEKSTSNPTSPSDLPSLPNAPRATEPPVQYSSTSGSTSTSAQWESYGDDIARDVKPNSNFTGPSFPEPRNPRSFEQEVVDREPPTYTPAPNARHGETIIESGPQHPFQPTHVVMPPQSYAPQQTQSHRGLLSQVRNEMRGSRPTIRGTIRSVVQDIVGQISGPAHSSSSLNQGNPHQYQGGPQATNVYGNNLQYQSSSAINGFSSPAGPPPGPVVFVPVDRRTIKGRRCKRCKGRGTVKLLVFDQELCNICGGTGRL